MELDQERVWFDLTNEADKNDASVLPEDQLRQLGRILSTITPRNGADDEEPSPQVQRLRLDLLHTAKSSNLSPSHGAAALNALCGFLDVCSASQNHRWALLCFCPSTCSQLFHIFLDRSENFKAKPAKQLLVTLVKALSKYPDECERMKLLDTLVAHCVGSISKQKNAKSIKSSMQALEQLVRKKIINAESIIIASTGNTLAVHREGEHSTFGYSSTAFRKAVEDFASHVLYWVQYPDCASAISRFLPCLFASLDAYSAPTVTDASDRSNPPASEVPFWIGPVKRSLERDISLLDSFENHVLPGLLRRSPKDRDFFLETLPLNELQQGNVGSQTDADIQLCLLAVKMEGLGLKQSGGIHPP